MKLLFKLDESGTKFDLAAFKHAWKKIKKSLTELNINPNKPEIKKLVIFCMQKQLYYQDIPKDSSDFDGQIDNIKRIILNLNIAIRSLKSFERFCTDKEKTMTQETIVLIKKYISNLKMKQFILIEGKRYKYSKTEIRADVFTKAFKVGENLGLRADSKLRANRKNQLFAFVKIFIGISSRTTIGKYYKNYKNNG